MSPSARGRSDGQISQPSSNIPPIHIVPFGPPAQPTSSQPKSIGQSSNNGVVQYYGGPVISNVQVVEVLWGSFVDTPSTTGLEQFFTDITQSSYFGLLAEYSTVGLTQLGGTTSSNQTIGPGTFLSPRITITPSLCPGGATNPSCTITDNQIQSEIVNQLNAQHLPTPTQDGQGNFNTIYMIYFPPGVTIIAQPGANSCQQFGFCAYHNSVNQGVAPKLLYGVFPDFGPTSGCSAAARGCGLGTSQQNLSSATSHELAEAVTDAQVGSFSGSAPAPPLAWVDQFSGEEIGDFCNHNTAQITVNSNTYTVQKLLSNMQGGCASAPAHFQISMPSIIIPGRAFNMTVIAENSINNGELSNYLDTVHFTSSDSSGSIPADYTFVLGDASAHTFSVTLNTVGSQTISAVDTSLPAMTGVATIDVEHNPDLGVAIANSPASFKQGETGDTYTILVTNGGDKATDGSTVTVTDSISGGLTVTAVAGAGWSCTVQANPTCTRNDALAASASYPPITVTVNVSLTAPSQVTSNVVVSGGGEANTSNDTAINVTNIVQFPDLVISKVHAGVFAQGQTGQIYTISVSNIGQVFSTGTVTVTDTLPTGLTATAISGTGWTCSTPPTLTCTRGDQLASFNQSYPPITLTVSVDANAPMPTVTNVATVSGGGEVNTGNDSVSDVTTITAPASDLTITETHSGTFAQGQAGGVLTLTVSNVGSVPTSGSVTARDGLDAGMTATAISGTGWTCDLPSVSCTRSDALAPLGVYPPITVQVSLSANTPLVLIPLANTFGGGETNTVNDIAHDTISVIPAPDLELFVTAPGMTQGQTGVVITSTVNNLTSGTTSGAITFVQTLPPGFTATALSGSGWSCVIGSLTCTRSDSLGPFASFPTISLTVDISLTAPRSFQMNMTISGGGEVNTGNDTSSVSGGLATPITINPTIGVVTVSAGGTANFALNVFSVVSGSAGLTCSGLPVGTACTFSPASINQGTTSVSMVVTTSGPALAAVQIPPDPNQTLKPALTASVGFPLLAIAIVAGAARRRGVRTSLRVCLAGAALGILVAGCGGGSKPQGPPPVVTPSGSYAITVTANNTSVNTQSTATVTLVVR